MKIDSTRRNATRKSTRLDRDWHRQREQTGPLRPYFRAAKQEIDSTLAS